MFSKKNIKDIPEEETPHSIGSRKLIAGKLDTSSSHFEAITYGYLPPNEKWAMHKHSNIIEICIVVKGNGIVRDVNNEKAKFELGDRFIFPANTEHELENTSKDNAEFYFFRVQDK